MPRRKTQYGVQVVWDASANVTEAQRENPRWFWFDSKYEADAFARRYVATVGDKLPPDFRLTSDVDLSAEWKEVGVDHLNRATRQALEVYSEPELY